MTSATTTVTGSYTIDPTHSRIGFVARHAMVTKVRGSFNELDGRGYFDADNPAASWAELTISAASIDTTTVNRRDWDITWNAALEAGGVLVGEKVTLELEVSAIRTGDAT